MTGAEVGDRTGSAADLEDGARFEGLGFTWCKIGSIALIALFPKPALLVACCLILYYYARALSLGLTRSNCILRHPLIIIGFWLLVLAGDMVAIAWPYVGRLLPHS